MLCQPDNQVLCIHIGIDAAQFLIHLAAPCHKCSIHLVSIGGELLVLMDQSAYFVLGHIQLIEPIPQNREQLALQ